ncbi:hypothetical protein B566_EDAN011142 [Ephemera danica]|nr:hypothetical protein B566_EDAN011142 [Ephemera danica]
MLAKWLTEDEDTANCTPAAILDFPQDIFTVAQRREGAAVLHAILAFYLFILLAIACDDYFVPAIERIVQVLQVSDDVGGATLMAAATSSPELFINVVGTFVTEGDLGVGAVLGSAVFNILAVPACCGIFASKEIILDWWPMTRDCAVYAISVIGLIVCLADELVYWYEAAMLVTFYLFYILIMYKNEAVSAWAHRVITCWNRPTASSPETSPLLLPSHIKQDRSESRQSGSVSQFADTEISSRGENTECGEYSLWWLLTGPIRLALWLTIPDCRRHRHLYPVTFVMCIAWIGATTYVITWMITVIGDTLHIPDSVMGITFLAAGTSVPEAVSSVIVTRQGHGGMGISNSLGSNTFDILLCLGLPWLIKSSMLALAPESTVTSIKQAGRDSHAMLEAQNRAVLINSHGLEYSAISLLSSTLVLFVTFAWYHFRLNRKVGVACLLLYVGFLALASTIELNGFFVVNLPTCDR